MLGLPSVGFPGKIKDDRRVKGFPYEKHPSSHSQNLYGEYSSEDEDERTNRVGSKGSNKPSGTFAVGLKARRDNHVNKQHAIKQSEENDDGCQLCAAEAKVSLNKCINVICCW